MFEITNPVPALNLEKFDVHPERGFLPEQDPLWDLSIAHFRPKLRFSTALASQLPKLLPNRQVSNSVKHLDTLDILDFLDLNAREKDAIMRDLSFVGHAFLWEDPKNPKNKIPKNLAFSWHAASKEVGRPPILSYKSYCLDNWIRLNPNQPIQLGNISLIRNFWGGLDEEWFVLVHVEIEARAARALRALGKAQAAVLTDDCPGVLWFLREVVASQEDMLRVLKRMPENCDPYIYYERVRPFIHGTERNPAIYEDVEEYGGQPQRFFGETGAQSSIIPTTDAFLGVTHSEDRLTHYLQEMRKYMPPKHSEFIDAVAAGPSVRKYIIEKASTTPTLLKLFNRSAELLWQFRDLHIKYAESFIFRQSQTNSNNPTAHGTGGTPFMDYLKKHRDETKGIEV